MLAGGMTENQNNRLCSCHSSGGLKSNGLAFLKYNSTKVFNFQQSRKKKRQAGYYSFYQ